MVKHAAWLSAYLGSALRMAMKAKASPALRRSTNWPSFRPPLEFVPGTNDMVWGSDDMEQTDVEKEAIRRVRGEGSRRGKQRLVKQGRTSQAPLGLVRAAIR